MKTTKTASKTSKSTPVEINPTREQFEGVHRGVRLLQCGPVQRRTAAVFPQLLPRGQVLRVLRREAMAQGRGDHPRNQSQPRRVRVAVDPRHPVDPGPRDGALVARDARRTVPQRVPQQRMGCQDG